MRKVGIIGGMGPEATLDLFQKIISLTPAGSDQGHLPILIDNNPQIPDRTGFLLSNGKDPLPYLVNSARQLEKNGADALCMPCNTAHFFIDSIRDEISVPFISIIEATYRFITARFQSPAKAGLLATTGTVQTRIYHDVFEQGGIDIIVPGKQEQRKLMEIIYGVKAGGGTEQVEPFKTLVHTLSARDVEVIIAGCTELPLLFAKIDSPVPVVDPTLLLAQEVVSYSFNN